MVAVLSQVKMQYLQRFRDGLFESIDQPVSHWSTKGRRLAFLYFEANLFRYEAGTQEIHEYQEANVSFRPGTRHVFIRSEWDQVVRCNS